jgi:RNA polymerase sigma-70 factor (ECF subfamily)
MHEKEPLEADYLTEEELLGLYQKHGAALAAYACSFKLDYAAAEDLLQEIFLKLLKGEITKPQSPVAYLYRAVRNGSLNHQRNRGREVALPDREAWFAHAAADKAEILSLQKALAELREEQRETIFQRIWSGMTLEEIAMATNTPLSTVASRYRYAMQKLRERLSESTRKGRRGNASG